MKRLKGILVLILLLALLASPIAVLASDISGAQYYGTIIVSNNSTATTNVAVNCTISTANLINGGYLNNSANNCVIRSSAGADLPFMPSVNTSYPWCIWVPSIGTNASTADILYTANSTGGEIRYFPDSGGMASIDSLSMELGDNFTIEQKGWMDTSYTLWSSKADFSTFTEVDANAKLTVTAFKATGADVDRDEDVYLYKDEGASYFDALDIDFEIFVGSTSETDGLASVAFSDNVVGTITDFDTNEIGVFITEAAPNVLALYRGNLVASDGYIPALDTPYYCTLYREAGADSANLTIYSDTTRETLLDTLVVAGYGTTKWRYVYGFVNYNGAQANKNFDGYVQDLTYEQGASLVHKPGAFITYNSGSGNITSQISDAPVVTASGVSSGEHTVNTTMSTPFWGIGVDTEVLLPISDNLILNIPLWQSELSSSPFTSIDAYEETCTVNNATWSSDGYVFDGTNDNIILPANWMPATGTIEMWVKYDLADSQYLFSSDVNEFSVFNVSGAALQFYYNGALAFSFSPDWASDTFFHLVITFTQEGTGYLFIDSIPKDNGALGGAPTNVATRLGEGTDGSSDFTGTIGDVRIYNVAWTITEILQNYNATKWKYDGTTNKEVRSTLVTVPDTANDWFYYQNLADYWKYTEVSVNGTQVQYIDWEYDTTFNDSSGFDNDATPTFRTTSSDADVSAVLTSFLPVSEAKAPAYALEDAPAFIETVPTIVSEWDVTPPAGTFPLAGVVRAIASATDTPAQLPLLIIAGFVIIAFSLAVSAAMRRYGSGSLIIKSLVITALMGIFIALGNFGIDFWMLFVFLVIAIALAMGSKQVGWQ